MLISRAIQPLPESNRTDTAGQYTSRVVRVICRWAWPLAVAALAAAPYWAFFRNLLERSGDFAAALFPQGTHWNFEIAQWAVSQDGAVGPLGRLSIAFQLAHGASHDLLIASNVALHAGTAGLLFLVLSEALGSRIIAACAATVFAVHPLSVASVAWLPGRGELLPLAIHGIGGSSYASTPVAAEYGKPFTFRFVLGMSADLAEFKTAWDRSDDRTIGKLLGYPDCCRDFFKRVWVDEGLVDTTWPMALNTTGSAGGRYAYQSADSFKGEYPLEMVGRARGIPSALQFRLLRHGGTRR